MDTATAPAPLKQAFFLDPSYPDFLEDRLFDTSNAALNRDDQLLPFARLREHLAQLGIPLHTADRLRSGAVRAEVNHYWSLGMFDYESLLGRQDVRLRGFFMLEPPLVAPRMYAQLPALAARFEKVYLHNTFGDGYPIQGIARPRLEKLYVPQPYDDVVEPHWSRRDRQNMLVVIAGLHNPMRRKPELYSKRIDAVGSLAPLDAIDLYGRGWERWWTRKAATPAYWRHRAAIGRSYRGACSSKMETLSRYRFSLCFENTTMLGYVTEKIFDCLYAGTVPVYLGAQDISTLIPPEAYVDMRDFGSDNYRAMWDGIRGMSDDEWERKREAGRQFIRTTGRSLYHRSLINVLCQDSTPTPAAAYA